MRSNIARFVVSVAVLTFVAGGLYGPASMAGEKPAVKFTGKWKYQSYRPEPVSVAADPRTPPKMVRWSPPGVVTVNADGKSGILEFENTPIKLALKIQVTDGDPARLAISAEMPVPGREKFTNELQGYLVPANPGMAAGDGNPLVVRGSIVQTSQDINKDDPQPVFTTGYFVLEPAK